MTFKENKKSAKEWIRNTRWHWDRTVLGAPRRELRPVYRYQPREKSHCCIKEREKYRKEAQAQDLIVSSLPTTQPKPANATRNSKQSTQRGSQSFATFLDLPAELRELIYLQYIQSYGEKRLTPFELPSLREDGAYPDEYYYKPIPPYEPALTRASRLIREESIPLFYSTHRFPIVTHLESDFSYTAPDNYHRLDPDHLRSIRKLELYFCFEQCDRKLSGFKEADAFIMDVDLDQRTNSYEFRRRDRIGQDAAYGARLVNLDNLQRAIVESLEVIIQRSGVGNFTARDFDRLIPLEQINSY